MSDPMNISDNIKRSIEYAIRTYSHPRPNWQGYTYDTRADTLEWERELAAFKAKQDAAQPRLKEEIGAYLALTERDDLAGALAAMHSPDEHAPFADCRECEEVFWPCTTAETIAKHHGIDLTDAHLYRWDESQ